jgi:hypothetical protein
MSFLITVSPRGARSRDGVVLQFLGGETPRPGPPAFDETLYFHSESADSFFEQIKGPTTPARDPEDREWGARGIGLSEPNRYSARRRVMRALA